MGLLALKRLISMQRERERRRRQTQARNGSITSVAKRKGSPCQQDGNSQGGKRMRYSGPNLPEDIWRHIHSLMPVRDAARAACVSRAFLHSWRCHPNLILNKDTLGLNDSASGRDFIRKIDHILKSHSGISVKTLRLEFFVFYDLDSCRNLNSWLQITVTPGIEEITLMLISSMAKYNFPCSLLSDGIGNSIRHLQLGCCAFRPTVELGSFRSLIRLHLRSVRITGDELGCLLSNSFALEQLELRYCAEITCLKIHCLLQRLSYLEVLECHRLRVIESKAPNLSSFFFSGEGKFSLGESLKVKKIIMCRRNLVCYARSKLPSSMPNLESLTILSFCEVVNTPMLPTKFLYLKYLSIYLAVSPAYDYFSLVSLLDASPSLETFTLQVSQQCMEHKSIFGDSSHLRQMTEHHHDNLKSVKIIGFYSAKSLVELICHIVENTASLECLTLDTTSGAARFTSAKNYAGKCISMAKGVLMEAPKALMAIRTYIEGKVPSTVKDIWRHIHSLMPLRDAARAACVSRAFLHSWRCHPNLTLNRDTLGLNDSASGRDFIRKIDHILKSHSGISVKTLRLEFFGFYDLDSCGYLNSWLQITVTPGIEEITLLLTSSMAKYNFPCSLLSDGVGNSIRHLQLGCCAFHPTVELGSFRSLIRLHLCFVRITGDELGCLLSNSFALPTVGT